MTRASDERPEGENSRSEVEGEARQSGAAEERQAPKLDRDTLLSESRRLSIEDRLHELLFEIDPMCGFEDCGKTARKLAPHIPELAALTRTLGEGEEDRPRRLLIARGVITEDSDESDTITVRAAIAAVEAALRSTPPQAEETGRLRDAVTAWDSYGGLSSSGLVRQANELADAARTFLSTPSSLPIAAEDAVESVAAAIRDVKGGLSYDYTDFCRDAARAAIAAMPASPIPPDHVLVERAELEDYAHVIGNLIGELSDPGTGALSAHYRIEALLSATPQPPSHGQGERNELASMADALEAQGYRGAALHAAEFADADEGAAAELRECPSCGQRGPCNVYRDKHPSGLGERIACVCGMRTAYLTGDPATVWNMRSAPPSSGEAEAVARALLAVVDAMREYIVPDGISADDFASRAIAALDNSEINPHIRRLEDGRS